MHGQIGLGVFVPGCVGVFGWRRDVFDGVGGCEGADGFDGGGELRFCSVGVPWAGAGVGSCIVGE